MSVNYLACSIKDQHGNNLWINSVVAVAGNLEIVVEVPDRAAELLRVPAEPEQTCPVCDGSGIIRERAQYKKCKTCDGTGKSNRSGRG